MAVKEILLDLCSGCGVCEASCPMGVLRVGDQQASIAYPEDCIVCFNCERDCPTAAIIVTPERPYQMPTPW